MFDKKVKEVKKPVEKVESTPAWLDPEAEIVVKKEK